MGQFRIHLFISFPPSPGNWGVVPEVAVEGEAKLGFPIFTT